MDQSNSSKPLPIEEKTLQLLAHYRHDWMNELQLIYGYMKLKKFDKLEQCVDKIREKLTADSQVSRLGNARLSVMLYYKRIACTAFELDLLVNGYEHRSWVDPEDRVHHFLSAMIDAMQSAAVVPEAGLSNRFRLEFTQEDNQLTVQANYEGSYQAVELKSQWDLILSESSPLMLRFEEYSLEDHKARLIVRLPIHNEVEACL